MMPLIDQIQQIPNDSILSPKLVADYLGITSQAVRMHITRGNIPAIKVGGRYWVKARGLKEFCVPVIA